MKTIVKLVLIFSFTGLIFSCSKSSNSNPSYYLKANFNGTEKAFNTQVIALKSNLGSGMFNLSITGIAGTEEGVLTLWSDKDDFTAGKTFTIDAPGGTTKNLFAYASPLGSSDATAMWTSTYDFGVVNEILSCTITEATSAYVKGTFSTIIYQNTDSAVVSKTVSEGQFYAKY